MLCGPVGHVYNLKTVETSNYWHLFIDQKCTYYEKVTKILRQACPPSFGQNPKEQQLFLVKSSLMLPGLSNNQCKKFYSKSELLLAINKQKTNKDKVRDFKALDFNVSVQF